MSIDKSLATIEAFGELLLDLMALVKGGIGLSSLKRLTEVVADLEQLREDIPEALPELKDIDAAAAARLGSAAYAEIQKVVAAGF